jgi:hypothetical protein
MLAINQKERWAESRKVMGRELIMIVDALQSHFLS